MAQAMLRGTRPISIGLVYARGLAPLQQEGLAMNVGTIPYPIPLAVPGARRPRQSSAAPERAQAVRELAVSAVDGQSHRKAWHLRRGPDLPC